MIRKVGLEPDVEYVIGKLIELGVISEEGCSRLAKVADEVRKMTIAICPTPQWSKRPYILDLSLLPAFTPAETLPSDLTQRPYSGRDPTPAETLPG